MLLTPYLWSIKDEEKLLIFLEGNLLQTFNNIASVTDSLFWAELSEKAQLYVDGAWLNKDFTPVYKDDVLPEHKLILILLGVP